MPTDKPATVEAYIATFPEESQAVLNQMRALIKQHAPQAEEKISYGMPAYYLNGQLVFFAGYKNHIGFYATPTGHEAFKEELSKYKQGKGSVQLPLGEPLPIDLIARIVQHRVQENLTKAKKK